MTNVQSTTTTTSAGTGQHATAAGRTAGATGKALFAVLLEGMADPLAALLGGVSAPATAPPASTTAKADGAKAGDAKTGDAKSDDAEAADATDPAATAAPPAPVAPATPLPAAPVDPAPAGGEGASAHPHPHDHGDAQGQAPAPPAPVAPVADGTAAADVAPAPVDPTADASATLAATVTADTTAAAAVVSTAVDAASATVASATATTTANDLRARLPERLKPARNIRGEAPNGVTATASRTAATADTPTPTATASAHPRGERVTEADPAAAAHADAGQNPTPAVSAGQGHGRSTAATDAPAASGPAGPDRERFEKLADGLAARLRISQAGDGARVRMQLDPHELGEVVVRLEVRDGVAQASLIADNRDAGRLLQSAAADLRNALADRGVQLDHVDVRVAGDGAGPNGDALKNREQWRSRKPGLGRVEAVPVPATPDPTTIAATAASGVSVLA